MSDDGPPMAEAGYAAFHRALIAVSAVEGLIGTGMVLVGGLLFALACAQARFHHEAATRHDRSAKGPR